MNRCDKTEPSTMSTVTMPPLVKRTKPTKSSSVGTKRRRSTKADSVDSGNDEESPTKKLRKRKSTEAKEVDLMALMADDDDDDDDDDVDVEEVKQDDDGYISYEELQEVWEAVEPVTKSARRKIFALEDLLRKNLALAKNQPRFRAVSRIRRSDFQKELKEAAKAINGTCEMLQEVAAVKTRIWRERRPPTPVPVEIPENVAYYSDISDDDLEEGCLVIDEGEEDAEVEPEVESSCLTTSEPETTEEQHANKAKQIYQDLFGTDFENDEDSSTSNDTNNNTRAYSPISEASSRPPSSGPCQPSIFDTSFDNEQPDVTNNEVFLHIPENPEDSPDEEEAVPTSFPFIVSVDSVVQESEGKSKEATVEGEIPLEAPEERNSSVEEREVEIPSNAVEGRNSSVEQPSAAVPAVKDECDAPTAPKVPKLEDPKSPEVENGLSAPVGALNESVLPTGAVEAVKDESSEGIAAENPKVEAPGSSDVEKVEPAVTDEEKPSEAEPITLVEEVSIVADRRPRVKDFISLSRQLWFIRVLMAKDKTAGWQQLGNIVGDLLAQTSWKLPLVQGFALMMNFLSDPVVGGGLDERSIQISSYLAAVVAAKLNQTDITPQSWQEVVKAFRGSSLVAYTGFLHIAAAGAFFKPLLGVKASVAAVSAEMERLVPSSKNANDMSAWKVLCDALSADDRCLPSGRIRGVLGMNAKKYRMQIFGDIRQRGGDLLKHQFVHLPEVDSNVDILVHPEYRKVFKWCAGYPLSWSRNQSAGHTANVSALRAIRPRRNSENLQDIRIVPLEKLLAPENEANTFSMPQLEEELMQQPTDQPPVVQPFVRQQPVPIVNIHRSGSSNARIIAVTVDMPPVAQLVQQQDPLAPAIGGSMAQPMISSTPQASGNQDGNDVRGQLFKIMKGHSKRRLSQQVGQQLEATGMVPNDSAQQVGQQSGRSVELLTTGSQQSMGDRRSESVENLQQLAAQNGPTVARKRSNPFEPASQLAKSSVPRQPLSIIQNAVAGSGTAMQQTMAAVKNPVPVQPVQVPLQPPDGSVANPHAGPSVPQDVSARLQQLLSSGSQPLLAGAGVPASGQHMSAREVTMPPPHAQLRGGSNQPWPATSDPRMSTGEQQRSAWSGTMSLPDYPINPGQTPANSPIRTVATASNQLEQNLPRQQLHQDIVLQATVASQQSVLKEHEAAKRARMRQAMAGLPPLRQRSELSPGKQAVHHGQQGVGLRSSVAVPPPARPLHQQGQSGQQVQQQSPILMQFQQEGHLQPAENLRQQQPQVVKTLLADLLQQQVEQVQHSQEQQRQIEQVQVAQQRQQLAIQQQYDAQLEATRVREQVLRAKQHLDAQQQRQQEMEQAVRRRQQFQQSQRSKQVQQDRMGSQMQQQQLYPPQLQSLQQITQGLGLQTQQQQQSQSSQFQNPQLQQQAMAPQTQQRPHPSQFQNPQQQQQAMVPQTQQWPYPSQSQNMYQQQQQQPSQFQNLHQQQQQTMALQTHQQHPSQFQNVQQQQGMALQNGHQQVNPQQLQNLHQQQQMASQMQQQQHPAQLQNPHQQQMVLQMGQHTSRQMQQQQVSPSKLQNAQFQQQQQIPSAAQFQQQQQMPAAAQFQQQQHHHHPQQMQQSGVSMGQTSSNLAGQIQAGQQHSYPLQNQGFSNPSQCCSGPLPAQRASRSQAMEEQERLHRCKEAPRAVINVTQRLVQPMQNQAPNPMMTQSQQQLHPPCYPNQPLGTYQQSFTQPVQNCCQMQHGGYGRQMSCHQGEQIASVPMQPTHQGNMQFPVTQPVAPSNGGSRSQNVGHQQVAAAQPLMSPSVGQNQANMPLHPPSGNFGCHPQQQAQGPFGAANHQVAAVDPRFFAQQTPSRRSISIPTVSPQHSGGWVGPMAGPSVPPAQNQPGNHSSHQNYVGQVGPSLSVQTSPTVSAPTAPANQMRVPQFFKPPTGHQASSGLPQQGQSAADSGALGVPPSVPSFNPVPVNEQLIDQIVAEVLHPQTGQLRDANGQLGPSAVAPALVPLRNCVGTQEQRILGVHRPSTPQLPCSSPEETMPPRPLSAPPTPAAPPQQDEPAGYKEGYEETMAPVPPTTTPAPATNPHPREMKIGKVTITCRRPKTATEGEASKAAEQPKGQEEDAAGDQNAKQQQEKAAEEFEFAVPHPVSQPSQDSQPTANTDTCVDQDLLNPEETCDHGSDMAEIPSEGGNAYPCLGCGGPGKFICYCDEANYCSKECQLKHWEESHGFTCQGGPASVCPAQPEEHV